MKRFVKGYLLWFSLAALPAVSTASANAQDELVARLDVDQDGLISLKEAVSHTELLRNFGLIDQNEDGLLSMEELAASDLTPGKTTGQVAKQASDASSDEQ